MDEISFKSEAKSWLSSVLEKDNFTEFSVNILGNSEKGDGYISDIVFAQVSGTTTEESTKEYDLVLKCSKRNQVLQENDRLKECFTNEIFFYNELLPDLVQFQEQKGVEDVFNYVPRCYGIFADENIQVIVLENLKKSGYELWPRRQPLTLNHIDILIKAYGQFHATSAAMAVQQPEKIQRIADTLTSNLKSFHDPKNDMSPVFMTYIEEIYDLFKDEFEERALLKWKNLAQEVKPLFNDCIRNVENFKVIVHGDSWCNNFMFKSENINLTPSEAVIIDWQMTSYLTPIIDLSYFLFSSLSKDDIENLNDILVSYYGYFSIHLRNLGINNVDAVYSFDQFMSDWEKYYKYGVIISSLLLKMCSADKEDLIDTGEDAEKNIGFATDFMHKIKNMDGFKNRIRHVVEYITRNSA